jgi:hypothetical protein
VQLCWRTNAENMAVDMAACQSKLLFMQAHASFLLSHTLRITLPACLLQQVAAGPKQLWPTRVMKVQFYRFDISAASP